MNVSFSKSWDRHLFRSPIICRHLSLSEIRSFCKFLLLSQNWHKCRRIPQNARLTNCEQSGANFKTVSLSLFVKDFLVQISVISKLFRLTDKTQNAARVKEYRRREKSLTQCQNRWFLIIYSVVPYHLFWKETPNLSNSLRLVSLNSCYWKLAKLR